MPLARGCGLAGVDAVGPFASGATIWPFQNTAHYAVNATTATSFLDGGAQPLSTGVSAAAPARPDFLITNWGTNSLGSAATVTTGLNSYGLAGGGLNLASQVAAVRPDLAGWAVMTVPIRLDADEARRASYNAGLPSVVDAIRAAGIPAWLFDLSSVITAADVGGGIPADFVHFNNSGQAAAGLFYYKTLAWLLGYFGSSQPRRTGRVPILYSGDSNLVPLYGGTPGTGIYPGGARQVCSSYYWTNVPPVGMVEPIY